MNKGLPPERQSLDIEDGGSVGGSGMIKQRWWWPNQLGVGLLSNSNGNSITKIHMENFCQPPPDKVYFHYNHTDPCRFSRWTARFSLSLSLSLSLCLSTSDIKKFSFFFFFS